MSFSRVFTNDELRRFIDGYTSADEPVVRCAWTGGDDPNREFREELMAVVHSDPASAPEVS